MEANRKTTISALLQLNEKERFLADFLRYNPQYCGGIPSKER